MDIALNQNRTLELMSKVKEFSNNCRISKIEKLLSDCFETMPENKALDYVGDFNKNDVMG